MNRRRILSSIHRDVARHAAAGVVPVDHSTIERLSIADLDRIGTHLLTLVTTPPVEKRHCFYCGDELQTTDHFPYCSTTCAANTENS